MEENGGGDGNSSVAELEVRVEELEGTVDDHETRISTVEADVNGKGFLFNQILSEEVQEHFSRLESSIF